MVRVFVHLCCVCVLCFVCVCVCVCVWQEHLVACVVLLMVISADSHEIMLLNANRGEQAMHLALNRRQLYLNAPTHAHTRYIHQLVC